MFEAETEQRDGAICRGRVGALVDEMVPGMEFRYVGGAP